MLTHKIEPFLLVLEHIRNPILKSEGFFKNYQIEKMINMQCFHKTMIILVILLLIEKNI